MIEGPHTVSKMHDDEVEISGHLVRRLLSAQFPEWAELSLTPVRSAGTDNALYRLGNDFAVRLPRIHWAVESLQTEQEWVPRLAPYLPVPSPIPVGAGRPSKDFPWPWSVYRWIEGEHPVVGRCLPDQIRLAKDLANFITAMRAIDPGGGPPSRRRLPLSVKDEQIRVVLPDLDGLVDVTAVTSAWEDSLGVPVYAGPPRWFHGDLSPFNVVTVRGRLAGVIDFGLMGVGDPSVDLIAAWSVLPSAARQHFRAALGEDDGAWARGRGWALSGSILTLAYYKDTNPMLAGNAQRVIGEILADCAATRPGRPASNRAGFSPK